MCVMVDEALSMGSGTTVWSRALDGSAEAWGQLFQDHGQAIYNFCFRRTGNWAASEDLLSTVFLVAWRRRGEVRIVEESGLPWLYGIATMLTRNYHRSLSRNRRALARIPPPAPVPDPADEVVARLEAQRWVEEFRLAARHLSRSDVEILHLVIDGRLSHQGIAAALDIPVGTVKSRLSRARSRLTRPGGPDIAEALGPPDVGGSRG